MAKITAIYIWPNNCDYPHVRAFLQRQKLLGVYVVITQSNGIYDRTKFITEQLQKYATVVKAQSSQLDWRHAATMQALQATKSDYVLFIEQDFNLTIYNDWHKVQQFSDSGGSVLSVYDGTRLHPCFLLVRRSILDALQQAGHLDFSANPPEHDHFGDVQKRLEARYKITTLDDLGIQYSHMAGLSHNLTLWQTGRTVTYKPRQFYDYLRSTKKLNVPLMPDYATRIY